LASHSRQGEREAFADAIALARRTDGVQTSISSGIEPPRA